MARTILVLFPALFGLLAHGEEKSWGARLELISEDAVIAAGQAFEVGVRIHHREGFHSYWKNPGVVGFATKIDWNLPEGFTAGPIVWPPPELVDMAGNTTHGYQRDVLLTTTITPPAELPEKEVTLRARIAWMACADACHPGDESFSLTLPVGSKAVADPETAPLFEQTRDEQPAPLDGWSVTLLSGIDAPEIVLQLSPAEDPPPVLESPYFFSSDGQVADGKPSISTGENGSLTFTFERARFGPEGAKGLPGLIAYGPAGDRRFAVITPDPQP
ncbi:protein-disulfide reductase DsbD domain-containing protein [Haloferula sp. A504]|uniref:protein-disulfide reductase DsbD domain-containing protein n=1 Tax=Haloferula sp. A504 TaxID=3373601 RepID=UPI0031CBEA55|nr:hypothetical protein [Verrucomicrobiaceae bacterium E54]